MRALIFAMALLVVASPAPAQDTEPFKTIQGPVSSDWTYDMKSGQWLNQPLPDRFMAVGGPMLSGPDAVYEVTTNTGSFYTGASLPGEIVVDAGNLSVRGVSGADQINCIRIGYATTSLTPPSVDLHFWDVYGPGDGSGGMCSGYGVSNAADFVLTVPNLPPSVSGSPEGFIVSIDLQGTGLEKLFSQRGSQGSAPSYAPVFAYGYDFTDGVSGPIVAQPEFNGVDNGDVFERINSNSTFDCLDFGGFPANPWGGFYLELLSNPTDIRSLYDSLGVNNMFIYVTKEAIPGTPLTITTTGIPNDLHSAAINVSVGFHELPLQGFVLFNTSPFVLPRHSGLPVSHAGGVGTTTKVVPLHWSPGKTIFAQAISVNPITGNITGASNALEFIK